MAALLLAGGVMFGTAWASPPGTIHIVGNESDFNTALSTAVDGDTIRLTADITLTGNLSHLATDLTIDGNGQTLNGNGQFRPFFVESGTVTIEN